MLSVLFLKDSSTVLPGIEGLSGILGPDGLMYLQHITLRAFLALLHDRIAYSAGGVC